MGNEVLESLKDKISRLMEADEAYEQCEPVMSDGEYDQLRLKALADLKLAEKTALNNDTYITIKYAEHYLNTIRSSYNKDNLKNELSSHLRALTGLEKVYSYSDFRAFMYNELTDKQGDRHFYLEPKYDGISISLIYKDGVLQKALTRGNGTLGEDITHLLKDINSIPNKVFWKEEIQINGELVISFTSFGIINASLAKHYKTPRSALMAFIRSNSKNKIKAFAEFLPYSKYSSGRLEKRVFDLKRNEFKEQNISILSPLQIEDHIHSIEAGAKKPSEITNCLQFPLDGIVVTSVQTLRSVAIKPKIINYASTTVRDVKWKITGKTAKLSGTLIVDPVVIGDKEYTKMHLKNYKLLDNNELMINKKVVVSVEDEMLNYERTIKEESPGIYERILKPVLCPRCLEPFTAVEDNYYCKNPKCTAGLISSFSRINKILKIPVSNTAIEMLIESGVDTLSGYVSHLIKTSDLFRLSFLEATISDLLSALKIPMLTDKDYPRLVEVLELIDERTDTEAIKTKIHKISRNTEVMKSFKRKVHLYCSFLENNTGWVNDYFKILKDVKGW